ncbi:hypothetical protein, partial [Stenotrophomonas maltophilia]|uniref:hypothetical protein n=1 Tax=Stenotrophomonas maltophilia TaxID=40324 RepID=UPI001955C8A2
CKYVHVSSVAASMRLTPLRNPPSRPRTVSVRVHPGLKKEEQKTKARSLPGSDPFSAGKRI